MRLDKFLAQTGVASRRASKTLAAEGRVVVNGEPVHETGVAIDPDSDDIRVDGRRVRVSSVKRYFLVNKPRGYLCTSDDPHGRRTVFELIPKTPERLFVVGRLDADVEGLVLLTNDGDIALRLTHPRYEVRKVYLARVRGQATTEHVQRLREGVYIEGKKTAPAELVVQHATAEESRVRLTIHEGRKHQVKLMCLAVGLPVKRLRRTQIGPLSVSKLPRGGYRELSQQELHLLRRSVGLEAGKKPSSPKRPPRRKARDAV